MRRWRQWTIRAHRNPLHCGLSLGVHIDPAPRLELHLLCWIISVGYLRMVDVPGFGVMESSADFLEATVADWIECGAIEPADASGQRGRRAIDRRP